MLDKLLDEHRKAHKLPGQYNGIDDVLQHKAIIEARPKPADVIAKARKLKGTRVRVKEDGSFTATVKRGHGREMLEMAHMWDDARKLQSARADVVRSRHEKVRARGRNGSMVEIHANNERELVRANALTPTKMIITAPAGIPRCGLPGGRHKRSGGSGRCWWCGKEL